MRREKVTSMLLSAIVILSLASGIPLTSGLQSSTLQKKWSYQFGKICYRMTFGPSPAVADIAPEKSGIEIITGTDEYYPLTPVSGRWFAFTSDGRVLWTLQTGNDESRSSVAIADIDEDGSLEMVGGTTSGSHIQCFNRLGKMKWTYKALSYVHSSPAVGDLDPEKPGLEIVAGSHDKGLYLIDNGGRLLWRLSLEGMIISSPAIGDVDGDGSLEVVVSASNKTWATHSSYYTYVYYYGYMKNVLYVVDKNGRIEWKKNFTDPVISSAALANLDSDNALEIVVGGVDGKIYCLDGASGKEEWVYDTGAPIYSSPAIGDVDGDGELEVVVGNANGKLLSLTARTGTLEWSLETGGEIWSSPALANRGGNGLGIYIGTGGTSQFSYSQQTSTWGITIYYLTSRTGNLLLVDGQSGQLIDNFAASGPIRSSPVVADVDGNGKLDVLFIDWNINGRDYDFLWCVEDTGSQVQPYSVEWGMFRKDERRTGFYGPPVQNGKNFNTPAGKNVRVVAVDSETGNPTPVTVIFEELLTPGNTTAKTTSATVSSGYFLMM
ncbi:MAG: PQQ-binding-like beta-propeller repeat protein, partial [Candidatus Hadarchaeales archaeon]